MTDFEDTLVVVPVGALGAGIDPEHVEAGLAQGAHAIALDAGSTDSGPSCLATGISKYSREAVKSDLRVLMAARAQYGVPLLIGTCGTAGGDAGVAWTLDIAREVASELGQSPKIATLHSELTREQLLARLEAGQISPLAPLGPLDAATVERCEHIVALMGPEPYIAALQDGADIVLGGRTTDTAVIAAVPLMRGAGAGAAWHAGKISECGGLCTVDPTDGGVLIKVGREAFEVWPLSAQNRCDVYSVSSHMLYENSDPFILTEPGGVLDVTQAQYAPIGERGVRVTGSQFLPRPYTMKLEGAALGPFQTLMWVGIADPAVLAVVDGFVATLHAALVERVRKVMGLAPETFDISLRPYGWNAVSGLPTAEGTAPPREIGLMFVATAETQDLATRIARTCNPYFFHFPVRRGKELPSYGFPFSPAEVERGRAYDFVLNHVVATQDGLELVRRDMIDSKTPEIA
ncbi:acyclic terpene utilization AtuA family protein [Caulobacter sp. RHG1]|uniref:acyclic terpene utilization AtuA family protein n=1 Tax=Caulobacter sp. (strain RHG1) TaxID=2545762 RepID=UPI001551CBCF|nr:acyclic terpene utilization AtuA family protein [Caulobacter sp. RHG1]NQE60604.1 3-methylaspartate ammonia-lyase, glutamate mutase [Caulobacter sp. RHG1]